MAAGLLARACLLAMLLVATTAAADSKRATGDEDAPPTALGHGRYHSEPQHHHQQQLPELLQESAQLDPAATATAARLVAALLRALAAPPPTESPNKLSPNVNDDYSGDLEDPWRGAARELAGELLADRRLPALLREPSVAAAMASELRGLRCEAAAQDKQQPHPPQRPDFGGAAGGAPLLEQPPLSDEAAIDSLRAHAGARVDEGDATAGSLRQRPPLPHEKKQHESGGGGPLLRAPRSAGASCAADGDCPLGQYCDSTGSCFRCSYISPT
eukprot:COSAG06_NODE_9702_length_1840_cov_3.272832_1_plen_271_part_10